MLGRCVRASSSLLELAAGFDLPFRSPWEGTVASITPSMRSHMMQIYASLEIRGSLWRISFLFYIYISIFKLTGKTIANFGLAISLTTTLQELFETFFVTCTLSARRNTA